MNDIDLNDVADDLGMQRSGKRRGNEVNYFCPIHDNDTPDLDINGGDKFNCLPSGEGGESPVTLVMHVRDCGKDEAIDWMKEHFPDQFDDVDEEKVASKQDVREALTLAANIAHQTLKNTKTEMYEDIKDNRSFTDETMEDAMVGFLSDSDIDTLISRFDRDTLLKTGLFGETEDGDMYCVLRGRVTFPYMDHGTVKYMTGRRVGDNEDVPKYKKIRKTDFNDHILLSYKPDDADSDTLIITEGVTDAISAKQAGFNVVSPVTKQFRNDDVDKVVDIASKYNKVYIAFDADEGGDDGKRQTAMELANQGIEHDPAIIDLPDGSDLDDWTSEHGYDLDQLLDDATYFIDMMVESVKEAGPRDRHKILNQLFNCFKYWETPLQYDDFLDEIPGRKEDLREQIEKRAERDSGESNTSPNVTEATEATEAGIASGDGSGAGGIDHKIEQLLDQEKNETFRMSGTKDQYNIQTVFLQDGGITKPVALVHDTETGETDYKWVNYKKDDVKARLDDDQSLTKEEKRKYDYWYIRLDDSELRYIHQPSDLGGDVMTASNNVLYYTMKDPSAIDDNLFERVRAKIKKYWDHYHAEWYDTLAAWVIHTYMLQDLSVTPYIVFRGAPNTGKSVCQEVLDKMAYNSFRMEDPTVASIQRSVNFAQSTVHMDEIDDMGEEKVQSLQKTANSGFQKGARRTMVNTEKDDIEESIEKLYTYSAKTFAANDTYNLKKPILDRSLIVNSAEASRAVDNIRELDEEEKEDFQDIRNQLMAYTTLYRHDIKERIKKSRDEVSSVNREEDKVATIHGILKHFGKDETADNVVSFIIGQEEMNDDSRDEINDAIVSYIVDETTKDGCKVLLKSVASYVNNHIEYLGEGKEMKVTSKSVTKRLKSIGFFRKNEQKSRFGPNGETGIKIPNHFLVDTLRRRGETALMKTLPDEVLDEDEPPSQNSDSDRHLDSAASVGSVDSGQVISRDSVLSAVDEADNGEGATYTEVLDLLKQGLRKNRDDEVSSAKDQQLEDKFESVINDLMNDGEVFEPKPGRVKVM